MSPTFTPLQNSLPDSTGYSIADGVSGDGSAILGNAEGTAGRHAARWNLDGTMTSLGFLPTGTNSGASASSFDGSVIVGVSNSVDTARQAFRWTAGGGMVGLGFLPPGMPFFAEGSRASDVSADGSVVVGFQRGLDNVNFQPAFKAWRWTQATGMVDLGVLPEADSINYEQVEARGISADGSVIVGFDISIGKAVRAFRWTQATGMSFLGDLPGGLINTPVESYANGVSADGAVIVGSGSTGDAGQREAWRWTQAGGMVSIGDLSGGLTAAEAFAVSGDGSVIVGRGANSNGDAAFIWDAVNGMRDLRQVLVDAGVTELTGWTLASATGISDDGLTIVGWGHNPSAQQQGWVAKFPAVTPSCTADFNGVNGVTVQDIFDFLTAWLAGSPSADFNTVNGVTVQDIFDFLTAWLAGC